MKTYNIPVEWIGKKISVALVGCGGTGSEMMDELYRIQHLLTALGGEGIQVTAYDPDVVSAPNIGRQRFWPCDIGFNKSEVLIHRVNNYGGVRWNYEDRAFDEDDISEFDIIITCVDLPSVRANIGQWTSEERCFSRTRLWIDCGNDSHQGNVVLGHIDTGENENCQLPNVYDLYPELATMDDDQEASCSTEEAIAKQDFGIGRSVAREGANLLWSLLRHGKLTYHCSFIDIREGTVNPLQIDEEQWRLFGYEPVKTA